MLTFYDWWTVEQWLYGTPDGMVPHLSFPAWRYVCALFEYTLPPEEVIRANS